MSDSAARQCHLPPAGFRGAYRDDASARAVYSEAAGIGRIVPAAVAVPLDADDVVTLVRWASARSLSLVPRGSGTSMAGGAIGSGVIVDLSRMNDIGSVDSESRTVWTGPGALRGAVNSAAGKQGLRFPVDPSSSAYCTVGGMVSTNAAGARTLRFGATRKWVSALDCVFEDGSRAVITRGEPVSHDVPALERLLDVRDEILAGGRQDSARHPGVCKESSGYGVAAFAESGDLVDLLAGSEGTLVIIVGVQLRLTELARATSGVLAAFSSLDDAVAAAVAARDSGAVACELLDRTFLDMAATGGVSPVQPLAGVPRATEALLLSEVEGQSGEAAAATARSLADTYARAGATAVRVALEPLEQQEIWELRHAASPILAQLDPSLRSMQFVEDGAVPPALLADYVRGVRAALDRRGVRGVIFGHAGDAHMHVNPLIDVSRPDWRETVYGLLDEVVAITKSLNGTLAGEHGDGRLRTPLLPKVWSDDALRLFTLVKLTFDPRGILNPGVKVPLHGQLPIGDVKYDPALAPLPDDARAVLDRVASEREYSRLRLALLDGQD